MEKVLNELRELFLKRCEYGEESCMTRKSQLRITRKKLLGKCFRLEPWKNVSIIKGEKYWLYIYIDDVTEGLNDCFALKGIVVDFSDFDPFSGEADLCEGLSIKYVSDSLEGWLDLLEMGEETSRLEFMDAKNRALAFISAKYDRIKIYDDEEGEE